MLPIGLGLDGGGADRSQSSVVANGGAHSNSPSCSHPLLQVRASRQHDASFVWLGPAQLNRGLI
jgi:hypothetical protein